MARILTEEQIDNVMVGATFLGAGGGGPLETGRELFEKQAKKPYSIELVSLGDIPANVKDKVYGAMIACLGSPQKIKENGNFGPDGVAAYNAFKKAMQLHEKKIGYLYSGEMGGMNTMVPMLVSIMAGQKGGEPIAMLDVDANGRAVPELNTSLNAARNFPPKPVGIGALPTVATAACTECIIECDTDTESENICRAMCQLYNSQVGFSTWAMNIDELQNNSVVGCVSLAERIGEAIASVSQKPELDLATLLNGAGYECRCIISGRIISKTIEVMHGFDLGKTVITDEVKNKTYTICFQNENLYVYEGNGDSVSEENVVITAPELISIFCRKNKDGSKCCLPMDNSSTEVGMEVDIIVSHANENWWKPDYKAYRCWKDSLQRAGYTGRQRDYKGYFVD